MSSFETHNALCDRTEVEPDDLTRSIEREVEEATCGQIGGLIVVRLDDAIVLHGHCRTYHASLLAQQAAFDCIEGTARLVNLIIVN